jgi:hypothetical protein
MNLDPVPGGDVPAPVYLQKQQAAQPQPEPGAQDGGGDPLAALLGGKDGKGGKGDAGGATAGGPPRPENADGEGSRPPVAKGFDPNEKRDGSGKWTAGGGEAGGAELDDHEGGRLVASDYPHEDYADSFDYGDPPAQFRDDFAAALAEKDDYAKQAADRAGAGDEFAARYAVARGELAAAGGDYGRDLERAGQAHRAVDGVRQEISVLRQAELEVEDYGEPPAKPKNPSKLPEYEAAAAAWKQGRAAAVEKAKAKRREEIEAERAKLAAPAAEFKAAMKDAKRSHAKLAAADAKLVALVRSLHDGEGGRPPVAKAMSTLSLADGGALVEPANRLRKKKKPAKKSALAKVLKSLGANGDE